MRFSRDSLDELFIKRDSTFDADNVGEQAVIITLPTSEAVPSRVECYSRNQHQVQMVCRKFGAGCDRFGDAKAANRAVAVRVGDFKRGVVSGCFYKLRQRNGFAKGECFVDQRREIQFVFQRRVEHDRLGLRPNFLFTQ